MDNNSCVVWLHVARFTAYYRLNGLIQHKKLWFSQTIHKLKVVYLDVYILQHISDVKNKIVKCFNAADKNENCCANDTAADGLTSCV